MTRKECEDRKAIGEELDEVITESVAFIRGISSPPITDGPIHLFVVQTEKFVHLLAQLVNVFGGRLPYYDQPFKASLQDWGFPLYKKALSGYTKELVEEWRHLNRNIRCDELEKEG